MRRPLVLVGVLTLPALLAGCLGGSLVGEPAPAFQLTFSDGSIVNETTHLGRFVILDLMATWCGPCKLEVAHLREIQRLYGDDVVILSISVSPSTDSMADMEAFAERYGAQWPHAIDFNGSMARDYGLRIIPKLVILDPEGFVVFERQGEVFPAAMARVIDPAGAAPAPRWFDVASSAAAGLALGFFAAFNPYRRFHRDSGDERVGWSVVVVLLALALLAWPFAGLVSSRATYGSLAVGAVSLGAVAWWARARHRTPEAPRPHLVHETGDRLYEAAPHFALVIVLALGASGAVAFFLPVATFLGGLAAAGATASRVPTHLRVPLGLGGLALAAVGLLASGARVLAV